MIQCVGVKFGKHNMPVADILVWQIKNIYYSFNLKTAVHNPKSVYGNSFKNVNVLVQLTVFPKF